MTAGPVVVLGAGRRGLAHLRTLVSLGVGTITVADHHAGRQAEALALGAAHAVADLAAAARIAHPEVVVVATTVADHAGSTLAALDLGAAVVVEKPVAHTPADLDALAGIAIDRFVVAAHAERWNPAVLAIAAARTAAAVRTAAFVRRGPAPATAVVGCDLDLAVHDLDLARHLLGPVSVTTRRVEPATGPPTAIELTGTGGTARLDIRAGWAAQRERTIRLDLDDGGQLRADLVREQAWSTDPRGVARPLEVGPTPSLSGFWAAVLVALAAGGQPPVALRDGLRAVALATSGDPYDAAGADV